MSEYILSCGTFECEFFHKNTKVAHGNTSIFYMHVFYFLFTHN